MESKLAVKVGIMVFASLALLTILYLRLAHINPNSYKVTVQFDDTKGLGKQSIVRMQGVNIGEVSDVQLDTHQRPPRPIVTLTIESKYDIPQDYDFVIASGLLITTAQINIQPPTSKNGRPDTPLPKNGTARAIGAESQGALSSLSPELAQTVTSLNHSVGDIQTRLDSLSLKMNNLLDHTTKLVDNSNGAVTSARSLIDDPKLHGKLSQIVDNFHSASENAAHLSQDLSHQLSDLLKSGKGKFDKLSNTAIDLSIKLGATLDDAREVVNKLTEQVSDPRLQQSLQETVDLARSTLASVHQITSDLHQITGDPSLSKNFASTVSNFNQASAKTNKVLDKVDNLLDQVSGAGKKGAKLRLPAVNLRTNISEQFNPASFRVDVDALVPFGKRQLFDLGVFDIGDHPRLDLQLGNRFTDEFFVRYGLYAGKIGAGLEYQPTKTLGLRADLFDPNHPRLDVRGLFRVNKNASVWVGVDSAFKEPVPLIGIQLNQ